MPNHGQRHKRTRPPWRQPIRKTRRLLVFTDEGVKAGVLARHIEEAFEATVLTGRFGRPIEDKMERIVSEMEGIS